MYVNTIHITMWQALSQPQCNALSLILHTLTYWPNISKSFNINANHWLWTEIKNHLLPTFYLKKTTATLTVFHMVWHVSTWLNSLVVFSKIPLSPLFSCNYASEICVNAVIKYAVHCLWVWMVILSKVFISLVGFTKELYCLPNY